MIRGGVYEQFRGALLGLLWGLEQQSPVLVSHYVQQWAKDVPPNEDWYAALPWLLAAWQQPLIPVPRTLSTIQLLLNNYLESAWQPESLAKPVSCLAAATDPVTRVRYALAIAPCNLKLAQQFVKEVHTQPLLGCLFGAYWGALALPSPLLEEWSPALAQVVDRSIQRWSGGQLAALGVAPAGRLRPRPRIGNGQSIMV